MSFRDDREAAHQRADALEQELRETKAEVARLRGPQSEGRATRGRVVLAVLGAVTLVAAGAGFWLTTKRMEPPVARTEQPPAVAVGEAIELPPEVPVITPVVAPPPGAVPSAPAAHVVWRGHVDAATGVALAPGAACTMDGAFAPTRGSVESHGLTIECGGQVIYQSTSEVPARLSLREGPIAGSAAHEYMLSYEDGPRPEQKASIVVSTLQHRVTITRQDAEPMSVTLFVRDVSDGRVGDPLIGRETTRQPSFAGALERNARVTAVRGHAPAAMGARCELAVRPVWEFPENCRMALRCGTTWVYGASESGYLTCEVEGGHPVAALDENASNHGGDPRVTWRGRRVTVSDFTEAGDWSMDLAL